MLKQLLLAVMPYLYHLKDLNEKYKGLLESTDSPLGYILAHNMYLEFIQQYNKHYSTQRFDSFYTSLKQIRNHNQNADKKWTQGITYYSDYSEEEFLKLFTIQEPQNCSATNQVKVESVRDPPESWDWREHGGVSPVKSQGHCGSCWTFSTVGAMEAHYLIFYKRELYFAEQQLVDCA